MRLYLCDDNSAHRVLYREVLADTPDLELVGAEADPRAAAAELRELRPDGVLVDVSMPGMDGFAALPLFRAAVPEAAIIMFSTAWSAANEERALALGASAYVQKPRDIFDLPALIRGAAGDAMALAQHLVERWLAGDVDRAVAALHDDVEVVPLSFAPVRGVEQVRRTAGRLPEGVESAAIQPVQLLERRDDVVFLARAELTRAGGEVEHLTPAWVMTPRDGKLARIEAYATWDDAIGKRGTAVKRRRLDRAGRWALAVAAAVGFAIPSAADAAIVQRTEHGVPHIVADDDAGIGEGYGYAVAQDQICLLAEGYATVAGERSLYWGPDATFDFQANGAKHSNLSSDLFYRQVLASGVIEKLTANVVGAGVRSLVRGYVRGYNRFLAEGRIKDPTCRGKPWVKPITEQLAYARFMQLASLAGGGLAITGIAKAQPPGGTAPASADLDAQRALLPDLGRRLGLGGLGSNAIALGADATRSGHGMVLGNPHLPWDGDFRLYQAHLTIPGEMDVEGATFIGVPFVVIGHTRGLAWSHTTSSAFRFTPYELQLAPGRPTTYLVDGAERQMTSRDIVVPVRDGAPVKRTLYSTEYGPVLTELLGLPLFPWTATSAYAFADANAENLRYLNHFHAVDRPQSVPELEAILARDQGIPWANTIAADREGRAYYADRSVVPHVDDALAAACDTALGLAAFAQLRLPILDGARSACRWGTDADAVEPGIFGPKRLPALTRRDYVENSNDSYWLTNPAHPLEGFARIVGDEGTERSLRTRLGLRILREGLANGGRFTLDRLQAALFAERQGAGELMRDALVSMCRGQGLGEPCEVLARWDVHNRLDSRGALLFQRWAELALHRAVPGANAVGGGPPPAGTWSDAFDPARPVDTPSQLDTSNPALQKALTDAVADLRDAGIALDAPLGSYQYELRGDERIPMHGGPGELGVFQALKVAWVPGQGYPDVPHGSTYIMATELSGDCPPTRTLLTYGQSADPTSPFFADQTRMFSRGQWSTERFCRSDVLASPALSTGLLGCLPPGYGSRTAPLAWIAPGMTRARVARVAGAGRRCVTGGGTVRVAYRRGHVVRVTSTARRHVIAGARPGARVPRRGWHRRGRGLIAHRLTRTRTAIAAVRGGRVRYVGVV